MIKTKKIPVNKISEVNYEKIEKKEDFKKSDLDHIFKFQIPIKSKKYLINRYLNHPIYKYHLYVVTDKKISNICVFRIVNYKKVNVVRFVDFIGSNKSFLYLKTFFLEILKIYKAEYLDFYSYGIPDNILKKTGLVNKKDCNAIIPNYFEPFVYQNIDIYFGFRKFNAKGKIRIFKGDGDLDRPSILSKKKLS